MEAIMGLGNFDGTSLVVTGPAIGSFVVTPDDNTDLPRPVRQVTVTSEGTIAWVSSATGKSEVTGVLPVGTYPMFASRILSTGTTAGGLTGWE